MTDAELLTRVVTVLRVIDRCSAEAASKKAVAALATTTKEYGSAVDGATNDPALQLQERLVAVCEALHGWCGQKAPALEPLHEQHRLLEHAVIRFWKRQAGDL